MRPTKLVVKNFLTYSHDELDLSKVRKALIVGVYYGSDTDSNGSGKSNLLRSIPWCIWGENPEAPTMDHNIKEGEDSCSVSLDLEHDGHTVKITRSRNKKKSSTTVDFIIDDVVSNGANVKDTNNKIIQFLNLDYNAYINSVYIRQDDIYSLANARTNGEGRELMERVLGLDKYDLYMAEAKEIIADLEHEKETHVRYLDEHENIDDFVESNEVSLQESRDKIKNLEDLIKSLQVKYAEAKEVNDKIKESIRDRDNIQKADSDAETRFNAVETELEGLQAKARVVVERINERKKVITEKVAGEDKIKASITQLEADKSENEHKEDAVKGINLQIEEVAKERSEADESNRNHRMERDSLQASVNAHKAEMKRLKDIAQNPKIDPGTKCEVCFSDITDASVEDYREHLKSEFEKIKGESQIKETEISSWQEKMDAEGAKIDKALASTEDFMDKRDAIEVYPLHIFEERQRALEDKLSHLDGYREELKVIESHKEIDEWKTMIADKKEDYQTAKEEMDKAKEKRRVWGNTDFVENNNVSEYSDQIDNAKRDVHILHADLKGFQNKAKEFDIIKEQILDHTEKIDKLKTSLLNYGDVMAAFSPKGIRSHILETAVEEVEREANDILPKISNGRLSITFKTKKEVKSSKKGTSERLVFEVYINDGEKTFPFSMYSGGEKFRISFVIRVALSKLLLRRANSKLEFLVIDEAVSPLDAGGVEKMITVINELQEYFKTILVITHRTDIKRHFDQVITVRRNEKGSKLEVGI